MVVTPQKVVRTKTQTFHCSDLDFTRGIKKFFSVEDTR